MNKNLKDILKSVMAVKDIRDNVPNSKEKCLYSSIDLYNYFGYKAKENGFNYQKPYGYKEKAVFERLIREYSFEDIKWLIDTAWDVKHNIMPKESMNVFILSKAFLRSLYPLMLRYRNGEIDKYGVEYDPRLHISKNKNLDNGGVWIAGIKVT